jgi:predicted nucleotidyltransferase
MNAETQRTPSRSSVMTGRHAFRSCTYGNEKAYYVSLEDLITMKKAAGRPKDIEDLNVLLRLKKRRMLTVLSSLV